MSKYEASKLMGSVNKSQFSRISKFGQSMGKSIQGSPTRK